jgi:hypothetical protein
MAMRRIKVLIKLLVFLFRLGPVRRADFLAWVKRDFTGNSPQFIKMKILDSARNVDLWIETGTYLGDTTQYLGEKGCSVISFEPSKELADAASRRFLSQSNIQIVNSLSEDRLDEVLDETSPLVNHLAFWLDGHFSEGNTYCGPQQTPITSELNIIAKHASRFEIITIFVDDFRCFVSGQTDYPAPSSLTIWADENGFAWNIQHDIFIMHNLK